VEMGEALDVDEVLDVVASGEAVGMSSVFMFADTNFNFGCYTDVEMFEAACKDVDVGDLLHVLKYPIVL